MSAPLDKTKKITDPRIRHCVVCGNDYHPSKSAPSMYCSLCDAVMVSLRKQDRDFEATRLTNHQEVQQQQEETTTPLRCCGGCKVPPVNPKGTFKGNSVSFKGNDAPVGLIPSIMLFEMGRAMKDGAEKHGGAFNWRSGETQKLMYHCNAAIGHILQFVDGENVASDSGISHLAHANAQLAIALDKVKCRLDVDDRNGAK